MPELLTNDCDYTIFALQLDFPGKLNPKINVNSSCAPKGISYAARWELDEGNLYKALGELRKKAWSFRLPLRGTANSR